MLKTLKYLSVAGALFLAQNAIAQCSNTNLNAWDVVNNPSGTLNVTAASAMAGTACGLEVGMAHGSKNYVQDNSPTDEMRYRQKFCFDPNGFTLPSTGTNRKVKIHNAQCLDGNCWSTGVVQFKLVHTGTSHRITAFVRDANSNNFKNKFNFDIPDSPTQIEYDLDMTNGTFKLWLNATSESDPTTVSLTGLDLSQWSGGIDAMRLGQISGPANVSLGQSYYIDESESRRQTFIGGTCN